IKLGCQSNMSSSHFTITYTSESNINGSPFGIDLVPEYESKPFEAPHFPEHALTYPAYAFDFLKYAPPSDDDPKATSSNGNNDTHGKTNPQVGSSKNIKDDAPFTTKDTNTRQQDTGKKKISNIASPIPALGVDEDEEEESHVDVAAVYDTCKKICSRWKWTSNGSLCSKGSWIILGWNDDLDDVMIMAQINQVMHVQVIPKRLFELSTVRNHLDVPFAMYLDTRVVNRKRNNKGSSTGNKLPKGVSVSKRFQVGKEFTYQPKTSNDCSIGNTGT
nr:RNA-directed DNA polymerase, eukaryota, reverse transcriptase zinc-binding domain protein [Tanacetum cinerariifolium]